MGHTIVPPPQVAALGLRDPTGTHSFSASFPVAPLTLGGLLCDVTQAITPEGLSSPVGSQE